MPLSIRGKMPLEPTLNSEASLSGVQSFLPPDSRAAVSPPFPGQESSQIIVAILYPSSQCCEIDGGLPSLQKQPKTASNLFQRGVEYGKGADSAPLSGRKNSFPRTPFVKNSFPRTPLVKNSFPRTPLVKNSFPQLGLCSGGITCLLSEQLWMYLNLKVAV